MAGSRGSKVLIGSIAIAFRPPWICDGRCNDVSQGAGGLRTPADEAGAGE